MDAVDPTPVETARRELREETGYAGNNAQLIGRVFPNPAIMSNTCFTVLIEHCQRLHPVDFDHGEDILTRQVPVAEIPGLVANGQIRHALVVVAIHHFDLWRKNTGRL
jgi:8-oxo-dGTP pyrophosphatase MutT (NUDIX family)